jgi:hypothetical protein
LVSRVWDISSGIDPCLPLAGGLCKFYGNAGGKRPIQRTEQLYFTYDQQELPKMQLTLLSQRKLALTAIYKLFA